EGRCDLSEVIFGQIRHEFKLGIPTIAARVDKKEACLYLHRSDLDEARKLLKGPSATSEASSYKLIGAEWSAALGWLAWKKGHLPKACTHLASAGADSAMGTLSTAGEN